jgi:hypothetical protein
MNMKKPALRGRATGARASAHLTTAREPETRGRKPKPVVEFPEAISEDWVDPPGFHVALTLHLARHRDSTTHLHRALAGLGHLTERSTIQQWATGKKVPRSVASMAALSTIERRYRLPHGYFKLKLPHAARAASGHAKLAGIPAAERRRLAWHLPDDFDRRPAKERNEILEWVRTVVISGTTDYRRFQAEALKHRYAVRFPRTQR